MASWQEALARVQTARTGIAPNVPYGRLPAVAAAGPGWVDAGAVAAEQMAVMRRAAERQIGESMVGRELVETGAGTRSQVDLTDTAVTIGNSQCDRIEDAILRAACKAALSWGADKLGLTNRPPPPEPCPEGYERDAKTGGCVIEGPGRYLPGDIGMPDYVWTPRYGRYGAGVTPVIIESTRRACPAGMVVGKDGICYDHLARTNRLHDPGAKPLLTGGDMNALRRAHQLKKAIGKINTRFGPKKAKSCPPGKKK